MYAFEDKNNNFLNEEVDLRLTELTAQGLIRTEEEYKRIVENALNSLDQNLLRLTDTKKYLVKKDDIVSSKQLNSLFVDLESDMRILHKQLNEIHRVVDITFDRNKTFYRRLKNRIASIWKEIQNFRETSFNIEGATYMFFESFSENSGMHLTGLNVDKKTGTITLAPAYIDLFNSSYDVSNVVMSLYPVDNKDGGVFVTNQIQNTFEYNFSKGDKTLLKDGLWKVQVLCADIPDIILNVFGKGNKTYKGIIAKLDIAFTSQKTINQLDIDPYGDFKTNIIGINYQVDDDGEWLNVVDEDDNIVSSGDVDWISLKNFIPITAKNLRIYFHQPNFQIIHKLLSSTDDMVDKMIKSLIEQRFEKIEYQYKTTDKFPSYDLSDEADLYDEIIRIIEEGGEITTLENQIKELLIPQPININTDIKNWKLFNLGAWSIEPKTTAYASDSVGIYISHDPRNKKSGFRMTNGSPSYAKIYTKQQEPSATSIEWSLMADIDGTNFIDIPIIANNDIERNESAAFSKSKLLSSSTFKKNKTSDNLIKLDFPIHPSYTNVFSVVENGRNFVSGDLDYFEFYNSTELYIPNASFAPGVIYNLRYIPAIINTVRCWILISNKKDMDLNTLCVFANEKTANDVKKLLGSGYSVVNQLCTINEYNTWFSNGSVPMFIDSAARNLINIARHLVRRIGNTINFNSSITKATWLYSNVSNISKPYSENSDDRYTWKELPSSVPTIYTKRKQY